MLYLTCVHAYGFDGALDYMSPSLDDGFHMDTHLIYTLVLWRTLKGYKHTWCRLSHYLREVIPHILKDVEPCDEMAYLFRHSSTHGV